MKRAWLLVLSLLIIGAPSRPIVAAEPPIDIKPIKFVPPEAEKAVLSNGVTVYMYESHELPIFDMVLLVKASPADDKPNHAMDLFSAVWRSGGTEKRSPDALDEELESMAASVESGAATESASLSMSCLTREMPKALDIWADVLLHPKFDEGRLALAKGQALEGIRRRNETPTSVGRRLFRNAIYGKTHVFADQPTPAEIKKISRGDLSALHKRIVNPAGAVIAAGGDFDRKWLITELEKRIGGWKPAAGRNLQFDYSIKSAPEGRVFLVDKSFSQSRITIGRVGVSRLDPDRFKVAVADYILGGGGPSRLFGEIRSRRGLAYMVGSFIFNPTGPGMIGVVSQTKSGSTVALIDAVLQEMKKFSEKPVGDKELDAAKAAIINGNVFGFDSPFEIAKAYATRDFYGYPEDELSSFSRRILAVTPSDVLNVAAKYYKPEGTKIAVVGDAAKFDGSLERFGSVQKIPIEDLDKK